LFCLFLVESAQSCCYNWGQRVVREWGASYAAISSTGAGFIAHSISHIKRVLVL